MKDVEALPAVGLAGVLVATARAARGLSVDELAVAAGCPAELIEGIETGRVDPALDTVGRIVNGAGFEVRTRPGRSPNLNYEEVTESEVERLRWEYAERSAFWGGPLGPPEGSQAEWDGTDPAPPRLFSAGWHRTDGGGAAALLLACTKFGQGLRNSDACPEATSPAGLAERAGFTEAEMDNLEAGRAIPTVSVIQEILRASGNYLSAWLELYDHHDDVLHLDAIADMDGYEKRMRDRERSLANIAASV